MKRHMVCLIVSAIMIVATAMLPQPSPAAAAEPVEIHLMHQFTEGSATQPLLARFTEQYMAEHPGVTVKWTWAGWEQFDQKLRAMVEAGEPLDAVWNSSMVLSIYAREGLLQPVDDALKGENYESDATWTDSFLPGLLDQALVKDAPDGAAYYSIPHDMHISGIFYNQDIFQQNGITPPETWAQLLETCEKLKAAGITPFAQDGGYTPYNFRVFMYIAVRIGGEQAFYDTVMHTEGTSWADNPDWLKAAEETQKLTTQYFQAGFLGSQWPAAQVEWAQGKEAMMIIPTWLPGELAGSAPETLKMGFFRFPAFDGGKGDPTATELKFNGFGILKNAVHPKETLEFLKFLTSREVHTALAAEGLTPAAVKGVTLPASLQAVEQIVATSKLIPFQDGAEGDAAEWMANVAEPLLGQLCAGDVTAQEFVAELQKQSDALYSRP
jgi:ABC-type glycerol-3-phosphate transport system substrate-binding protein